MGTSKGVRIWVPALLLVVLFPLAVDPPRSLAAEILSPDQQFYLLELTTSARAKRLWETRSWHVLLHYRADLLGSGVTSDVDDADFFLAPDGKTNPQAELEATLHAFFTARKTGPRLIVPQCAFPARYRWLKSRLGFVPSRLPEHRCQSVEKFRERVKLESVSLVFSSHYLNNFASFFGHTLLRFNQSLAGHKTPPQDVAVNYAAVTVPEDNVLAYTLKGLLGGYLGEFALMPYHQKAKGYLEKENRDLWEYQLNLTREQLEYLLLHTWEMGNTHFDYYFFTENCSFHLLSLLDVARPDLHLTTENYTWTIPADTIKKVFAQPGLVRNLIYRPALGNRVELRLAGLDDHERGLVFRLIEDQDAAASPAFGALPPGRRAGILDTALNYYQYKLAQHPEREQEYRPAMRSLSVARSRLPPAIPGETPHFPNRPPPPHLGHDLFRVALSGGASRDDRVPGNRQEETFYELSLQPGFHDLLSSDEGYPRFSQHIFLNLRGRYETEVEQWRLERFTVMDIVSLYPLTSVIRKLSWKFSSGWKRNRDIGCANCTPLDVNPGIGLALRSHVFAREVYFAFLEASLEYSGEFEEGHRAGFGISLGTLWDFTDFWRLGLIGSRTRYTEGNRGYVGKGEIRQRFRLSRNSEIAMDVSGVEDYREGKLGFAYHF